MRDFRPRNDFLWLQKLKFSKNFEEIYYILEKIYKIFWKMQHKRPRLGPVRFSKICNLSVRQVQFCNLTARNLSVHWVYSIIIIVQIAKSKEILNINKVSTFSIKQYKEFQYSECFIFSENKIKKIGHLMNLKEMLAQIFHCAEKAK